MQEHVPVLLTETLEFLSPSDGEQVLDVTLGLGGHAEAVLRACPSLGGMTGLDADTENLGSARERLSSFGSKVLCLHANFGELPACLPEDRRSFDIILADLGLSSPHLDDPERGFSFRIDSPLDMRYDRNRGMSAAMVIASFDRIALRDAFAELGELPQAHRLADALIARRKTSPVRTSANLVDTAKSVYGHESGHVLPQIFQALRMIVNDEMRSLKTLLVQVPLLLRPGGRLVVISYHSLEDRSVKQAFKALTDVRKDPVTGASIGEPTFELLTKKPVMPTPEETKQNPRARSARLRAIRKCPVYTSARLHV